MHIFHCHNSLSGRNILPPPSLPFLSEKENDGVELLCANLFVLFSDLSPPLNYMTLCGW